ncbi:MAG: sigma-70 family RNA polymerase sigma factor [Lachnospiraceae bacterium]|nr:sigma-70 family RNA polymerase sigma factor [Lachnospiraceae bacterium]
MEKNYGTMTDEELVAAFRNGETGALDCLMERYKDLVRMKANTFNMLGGEKEDLIQEGMIGLYRAIQEYDCRKDAGFSTFCQLVVQRKLYSAVRSSRTQKQTPLNSYISLNKERENEEDGLAVVLPVQGPGPEELAIGKEEAERIQELIKDNFSPMEKDVFELLIIGMENSEIAKVLGKPEKSVENALYRLRNKLKGYLNAV